MAIQELKQTIKDMVIVGKGILAADESSGTAAKRLSSINLESTEETRRQYRNLMLTTPGIEKGEPENPVKGKSSSHCLYSNPFSTILKSHSNFLV